MYISTSSVELSSKFLFGDQLLTLQPLGPISKSKRQLDEEGDRSDTRHTRSSSPSGFHVVREVVSSPSIEHILYREGGSLQKPAVVRSKTWRRRPGLRNWSYLKGSSPSGPMCL